MNIGDFQVERPIARGGMGEVFEATQLSLGRKVALKVVASERNADRSLVVDGARGLDVYAFGADGPEREAFTGAYDTLRGRLGLPPVVGEF